MRSRRGRRGCVSPSTPESSPSAPLSLQRNERASVPPEPVDPIMRAALGLAPVRALRPHDVDPWPDVLQLVATSEPRPFPADVLPGWLRDHSEAVADSIQ